MVGSLGNIDLSRLAESLYACGDIDGIAHDVIVLVEDISQIDANPHLNDPRLVLSGVLLGQPPLYSQSAATCLQDAVELCN